MSIKNSRASQRNPAVQDWTKQYERTGNLRFFKDALAAFARDNIGNSGMMVIGLLGQRDIPGYTLRAAQSILRWDVRPSLWSHAFLIKEPIVGGEVPNLKKAKILEAPLHARTGEFPRPERNGVGEATLGDYDDRNVDANAALLAIKMTDDEARLVQQRAHEHNYDRTRYNLWESLGIWQGFLWANGERPNPLREGVPIVSSAYIEMAFEAIMLDITPGASERNSAPEHIWNAALWWHETFAQLGHPISGYCVLRNQAASLTSAGA